MCSSSHSKKVWRHCFSKNRTVLKTSLNRREEKSLFQNIKSQIKLVITVNWNYFPGEVPLISIHGEACMNTYQGSQNRPRKKSLGNVCHTIFGNFLSCLYHKPKNCLDSCFLQVMFLLRGFFLLSIQ